LSYVFHINENYHIMQARGAQPFFKKKFIFIQKYWVFYHTEGKANPGFMRIVGNFSSWKFFFDFLAICTSFSSQLVGGKSFYMLAKSQFILNWLKITVLPENSASLLGNKTTTTGAEDLNKRLRVSQL